MREEAEDAYSGDAVGAAGPAGSDAGRHPAKHAHQNAEENLDVHEVPPRCDQLSGHRPRRRGDQAYGGEVVWDDLWDAGAGGVKRRPALLILSDFIMHHQKYHSALQSAVKYRMIGTGDVLVWPGRCRN